MLIQLILYIYFIHYHAHIQTILKSENTKHFICLKLKNLQKGHMAAINSIYVIFPYIFTVIRFSCRDQACSVSFTICYAYAHCCYFCCSTVLYSFQTNWFGFPIQRDHLWNNVCACVHFPCRLFTISFEKKIESNYGMKKFDSENEINNYSSACILAAAAVLHHLQQPNMNNYGHSVSQQVEWFDAHFTVV